MYAINIAQMQYEQQMKAVSRIHLTYTLPLELDVIYAWTNDG